MGTAVQARVVRFLDSESSAGRILWLAVLIRLLLLVFVARDGLEGDSLDYQRAAQSMADGRGMDTYWPPGLPLYEALVVSVFGKSAFWLRLAMVSWFIWLCHSFHDLAFRLHSRIAANLGLLFLAVYPEWIFQSVEPLSYLPAAALFMASLGFIRRHFEERRRATPWKAGITLGVLVLFRPSALLLVLAIPLLFLFRRRQILPGIMVCLVAGMVVGGWLTYAGIRSGRFIPVNDANARNLYLGNNAWTPGYKTWYYGSHWTGHPSLPIGFRRQLDSLDRLPVGLRGRAFGEMAWKEVRSAPGRFAVRSFSRIRSLMAFDTFTGTRAVKSLPPPGLGGYLVLGVGAILYSSVLSAALLSLFSEVRRELSSGDIALIGCFLLAYAFPHWLSFSHPTYHLPMLPMIVLLAAVWGEIALTRRMVFPGFPRHWFGWLLLVLALGIQVEWLIRMLDR
jgi:4-amino-4-deoxy-L-arabinose transferase-like glycosyltransferase